MKRAIKASIDIHAPPEKVWEALLDFPRYSEWSKFLQSIEGRAVPGSHLYITQMTANGQTREFKATVSQVTPPRSFRWIEHLWVPGLLDREHEFALEYQFGGHTRVRQTEEIGGFLKIFLERWFDPPVESDFTSFNRALKRRTESRR
jgi:hypothetical protein